VRRPAGRLQPLRASQRHRDERTVEAWQWHCIRNARPANGRRAMSNITVRNQNPGPPLVRRQELDPMGWARELLRWDPFREMAPGFPAFAVELPTFAPAFDVKETKDGYLFKADIPGVAEKDLEITRTGNRLIISGRRESEREEKHETYYACERSYGSFARAFTLPDGIDGEHIRADLSAGVLTLLVPKKPEAQPQKISVKPAEKKS
jgi:HSP20 family protein